MAEGKKTLVQAHPSVEEMLAKRATVHGDSWLLSGRLLAQLHDEGRLQAILETPHFFAWTMLLNKTLRMLVTPDHIDHWDDVAGYARLVTERLQSQDKG